MDKTGEASRFILGDGPRIQFVAFGPLTNLAAALLENHERTAARIGEVVIVGSNASSAGRWPPLWPAEFNLTQDLRATRIVFDSGLPLTFAPLDLLKKMRVTRSDLGQLDGTVGEYLRRSSRRWLLRARLLKWSGSFPLWDLVAAMYVMREPSILTEIVTARIHRNGWIEYGAGNREVTLLTAFDRDALWKRFVEVIAGPE